MPATVAPRLRGRCRLAPAALMAALLCSSTADATPVAPALAVTFPVGSAPFCLAAGDLDGDGIRDLVCGNAGSASFSVLLGKAKGGFAAKTDYSNPGNPAHLSLADFNNDGRLDLAVASGNANCISVRLGDGTGGFGPATNLATDSNTRGCAVGDLNLDGRLDLVSANLNANTLSIFLGDGAGGFAPAVGRAVGNGPAAVAIGDIDHDGIPDLVTADFFGNTVTMLTGSGNGTTFLAFATASTPANPVAVVLADVSRDGWPDVVVANYGANGVTRIPINSPGILGSQVTTSVGTAPDDIAVGIDRLGRTCFATTNIGSSSASLLTFDGAGALASNAEYTTNGFDCHGVLMYDVDGDGQLDILASNNGSGTVSLIQTAGDALFRAADLLTEGVQAGFLALGDLDGDSNLDVVTCSSNGYGASMLGNGDGTWRPRQLIASPSGARAIALADMTSDGRKDLICPSAAVNALTIHTNIGSGSFALTSGQSAGGAPWGVAVPDLNLDSKLDVVVTNTVLNVISYWTGTGAGTLGTRTDVSVPNNPTGLAVGKLNADVFNDIVTSNRGSNTVSVLLADIGGMNFQARTDYIVGTSPVACALGDLNGDGRLDLVTANETTQNFSVLLGTGTGAFGATTNWPASGTPRSIALADMNGDGRLDVVAGLDNGTAVALGDGKGTLFPVTVSSGAGLSYSVVVGDVSNDGRLDVVTDTFDGGTLYTWLEPTRITVALTAPALAVVGQPMVLNAVVSGAGPVAPTGTVRFFDGTSLLGSSTLQNGVAGLVVAASFRGERQLMAVYEGGGRFCGAISNVVKQRGVASARPAIAAITDVKSDQGGRVRLKFNASAFDYLGSATPIVSYSVYRQVQPDLAVAGRAAGFTGGRATVGSQPVSRRAVTAAAAPIGSLPGIAALPGVDLAGWDFVTTLPASAESAYELVVSTLADSNALGTHDATFFVRAATTTPATFYDSPTAVGHSIDNLPPAPPAPFVAAYSSGATHLHWGANTEADLWYYALHRGTSAGFTPDATNRIGTPADTGFVDAGPAGAYFKLAAVDVNGNVSAYTLLTPGQTVAVGGGSGSLSLALEGARPNPAVGGRLTVAFTLPSAGGARLEVLDVTGRLVASRDLSSLPPGRHVVELAPGGQLAAGVYLLRLGQGSTVRMARATVLE